METVRTFPILFKLKDNQKWYSWKIEIESTQQENNQHIFITTHHGEEHGKKVKHSKEVEVGKCGRTCLEQAEQEANRKWINKRDKELYSERDDNAINAINPNPTRNQIVVRPMLAQKVELNKKGGYSIPFPAMAQRKYDGIRCIAHCDQHDNTIILESRKGTRLVGFQALTKELEYIYSQLPSNVRHHIYLDGELFTDRIDFETISGLVRKNKPILQPTQQTNQATQTQLTNQKIKKPTAIQQKKMDEERDNQIKKEWIDFHIYDMVNLADPNQSFKHRLHYLQTSIPWSKLLKCKLVETFTIDNLERVKPLHDQFVAEGYEGIMLRDSNGLYQINKRSKYLQKYKEFMDEEFQIVGFHEGTGNEKGAVVWDCKTKKGQPFAVRPRGTFERRKELFQDATANVGSMLTVIFQEYSADGVPRFPVGKSIRPKDL
jgi:ATP-dependent DNA ligase